MATTTATATTAPALARTATLLQTKSCLCSMDFDEAWLVRALEACARRKRGYVQHMCRLKLHLALMAMARGKAGEVICCDVPSRAAVIAVPAGNGHTVTHLSPGGRDIVWTFCRLNLRLDCLDSQMPRGNHPPVPCALWIQTRGSKATLLL